MLIIGLCILFIYYVILSTWSVSNIILSIYCMSLHVVIDFQFLPSFVWPAEERGKSENIKLSRLFDNTL